MFKHTFFESKQIDRTLFYHSRDNVSRIFLFIYLFVLKRGRGFKMTRQHNLVPLIRAIIL